MSLIQPPCCAAARKAICSEVLVVADVDRLRAEFLLLIVGGGLLNEDVFGVVIHACSGYSIILLKDRREFI